MKKIISFLRHSHPEVYKGILFILTIAIIVYIFPKEGKFQYEFHNLKGKPWYHDDLIAPFDFAIKKTKEELANEKAEIIKNFKPYYYFDTKVTSEKKAFMQKEFDTKWTGTNKKLKDKTLSVASEILDSVYSKGIIVSVEPPDLTFLLLKNNVAEEHKQSDFFTITNVFPYIEDRLKKNEKNIDSKFALSVLENCITQCIFYDKATSDKDLQQTIDEISPSHDKILKDQSIISKGEIIDDKKYQILESLKAEYEGQTGVTVNYFFILLGQILIVTICMAVLAIFLLSFRKEVFQDNSKLIFILFLIILQVMLARIAVNSTLISIYALPFCILPIIIRAFYDTRVALFVNLVTVLLISFMAPSRFEYVFIQMMGGMVAIFSIVNMRNRSQIFISASVIFVTYCLAFLGITIMQEGGMDAISARDFAWFGISATLTLFSYPLIFIFEKIFGFLSDVSLLELSDTNRKLLRELASRAPGTFQHSLQVANLAEEAIYNIGGNTLLVRTGALYHDIGKMEMPMYFIENQANGINPHDDLSFDESASIIISHVIKGIEIAKHHKLPEQIIDFIRTHHGTSLTSYFYRSFKKEFPEEKIAEGKFHYPGPIPFSKETAVLMMADSVEAASRSLKKYDAESIDALVETIINTQIEQNQFINADITFRDINTLKKIFKKKLLNVYHIRVEYPR